MTAGWEQRPRGALLGQRGAEATAAHGGRRAAHERRAVRGAEREELRAASGGRQDRGCPASREDDALLRNDRPWRQQEAWRVAERRLQDCRRSLLLWRLWRRAKAAIEGERERVLAALTRAARPSETKERKRLVASLALAPLEATCLELLPSLDCCRASWDRERSRLAAGRHEVRKRTGAEFGEGGKLSTLDRLQFTRHPYRVGACQLRQL